MVICASDWPWDCFSSFNGGAEWPSEAGAQVILASVFRVGFHHFSYLQSRDPMADNFFLDNPDLQFHFEHALLSEIFRMREDDFSHSSERFWRDASARETISVIIV